MPLRELPPKAGSPVIDAGDLQAFLEERGVNVEGIFSNADGKVFVETLATTSLTNAWDEYAPPEPLPPPPTMREQLTEALSNTADVDGLKVFLSELLIPALVPDV